MGLEVGQGHEWDCTKPFKASVAFGEFRSSSTCTVPHRGVLRAWQATLCSLDVNKTRLANRKTDSSRTEWRFLPPLASLQEREACLQHLPL